MTYERETHIIILAVRMQEWWNRQTRRLQVPVVAIPCGFKSHLLHFFYCPDAVEYDKVTVKKVVLNDFGAKRQLVKNNFFYCAAPIFNFFLQKKGIRILLGNKVHVRLKNVVET